MNEKLPKGYTARGATMEDLEIAAELMNAYSLHYWGIEEAPLEGIRNEWQSPGFDPTNNIHMVFSPEGKAVGYIEVWDTANPPVHPWAWWRIHPEYQGNGVGPYLLSWAEQRAQQAVERCPAGTRVALRSGADSVVETAKAVLEARGMKNIRHSFHMRIEMETPPPEPIWPEGITLKVFDLEHDDPADVYRADNEAFRDHFGYVEQPFEEGFERFKHFMLDKKNYLPGMWFLAMEGSQIVGICLCSDRSHEDPALGWVNSLGVLRPWRKQGIGLALLRHSFGEFYRRSFRKVGLGVDGENLTGALRLYKKAGMHVHRRFDLYEKELRPGDEISVESL